MKNLFAFITILFIACLLTFTYSCKKTNNNAQAGPYVPNISYPKIDYEIDSVNGDTIYFFYNSQGNLIKEKYTNIYVDLVYTTNKVNVNVYENYSLTYTYEYFLNSSGLATTAIETSLNKSETNNNNLHFINNNVLKNTTDTTYYYYNSYGYLISAKYGTELYNYTYLNGNLTTEISPYDTTTYQYFDGKLNTVGNNNIGVNFLGKQNKNLLKTTIYYNSGQPYQTVNYNYEYDINGRVKTEIINSNYSNQTTFYKYVN